jgi:hypothetical protein
VEPASKLSEAEQRLWDAFQCGEHIDLRINRPGEGDPQRGHEWGPERQIRAEVIVDMALSQDPTPSPGRVRCLHVRGARIVGPLTFRHARVLCPIAIEDSYLEDAFDASFANVPTFSLSRSYLRAAAWQEGSELWET